MLWKTIKLAAVTTTGAAVLGGALLGSDLLSYVGSSYHSVSGAVKENIPVEFQIRRARDLLDAIERIFPALAPAYDGETLAQRLRDGALKLRVVALPP